MSSRVTPRRCSMLRLAASTLRESWEVVVKVAGRAGCVHHVPDDALVRIIVCRQGKREFAGTADIVGLAGHRQARDVGNAGNRVALYATFDEKTAVMGMMAKGAVEGGGEYLVTRAGKRLRIVKKQFFGLGCFLECDTG